MSGNANYDSLLSTTLAKWASKKFNDNIFKSLFLFFWLTSNGRQKPASGGTKILEPLMYGKNTTVQSMSGYDTIDTSPQEGFTMAEFNWKMLAGSVTISEMEELKNSGDEAMINLLESKIMQLEMSLQDEMNTEAFADGTGNGGKNLLGLEAIVSTSGTLAGIDRATETWWRANVEATVEALSIAKMTNMYNTCSNGAKGQHPDFSITTQALFEKYEGLLQQNMRFTDNKVGDAGFENLKFKGSTISFDEATPSGVMYFLNSKFLALRYHPKANFRTTPFVKPPNQLAKVAQVLWMGNLTVSNCRRLGKLTNKS
ncbi:MAG: phage major capsid protein [Bacillota bacterium]